MDVHKFLEGIYKELKKLFTSEEVKIEKNKKTSLPNVVIVSLSIVLVCTLVILGTDYFRSTSTVKINSQSKPVEETSNVNTQDYEIAAENKLTSVLEEMDGVGKVKVLITLEGSEEQVPAVNINDSTSTTNETDNTGGKRDTTQKNEGSTIVITNDGVKSQPLIVKTNKPKVIGVCVVAEGAKDKLTQLQITQAVTRLYNITPDKVTVYPMKK